MGFDKSLFLCVNDRGFAQNTPNLALAMSQLQREGELLFRIKAQAAILENIGTLNVIAAKYDEQDSSPRKFRFLGNLTVERGEYRILYFKEVSEPILWEAVAVLVFAVGVLFIV